jgi:hypothetical protein
MNTDFTQVTSSLLAANTLSNFSNKMKYRNVWLHLFSINPQITVVVVFLRTCTWTFRYGVFLIWSTTCFNFVIFRRFEVFTAGWGDDSDLLEYDNLSRGLWFPTFRKQYVPSKRREPLTQWHIVVYKKVRILISVGSCRNKILPMFHGNCSTTCYCTVHYWNSFRTY